MCTRLTLMWRNVICRANTLCSTCILKSKDIYCTSQIYKVYTGKVMYFLIIIKKQVHLARICIY